MNSATVESKEIKVGSFNSMHDVVQAFPFVGDLTPAQVAVVPMNPPKINRSLRNGQDLAQGVDQAISQGSEAPKRSVRPR